MTERMTTCHLCGKKVRTNQLAGSDAVCDPCRRERPRAIRKLHCRSCGRLTNAVAAASWINCTDCGGSAPLKGRFDFTCSGCGKARQVTVNSTAKALRVARRKCITCAVNATIDRGRLPLVKEMVRAGMPSRQIADRLGVTKRTIERDRSRLKRQEREHDTDAARRTRPARA